MSKKEIPIINNTFTNINKQHFDKVREIAFKKGELIGNIGTFVDETKYETNFFCSDDSNLNEGVYIYQSFKNPLIAYRIYKSFAEDSFNGYRDDELIQNLLTKQSNILLTNFPTGVVTLDGRIIGQEIPYYPCSINLFEGFKNNKYSNLLVIYKNILKIIEELYNNDIIYLDIHPKNFMLNKDDNSIINLIDFDYSFIKYEDYDEYYKKQMLYNYASMVNRLNELQNIDSFLEKNVDNFDDIYEQIYILSKKLN